MLGAVTAHGNGAVSTRPNLRHLSHTPLTPLALRPRPLACPFDAPGIEWTGGVAATLVDSLDMLLVVGNASEFERAVLWLEDNLSFDVDVRVNVFESTIRLLGGLVSAHQLVLLSHERGGGLPGLPALGKHVLLPQYDGVLLRLAGDLAKRLLPAFSKSKSDVPLAWVNLRHGVPRREVRHTCTAGAGTLLLEFTALQRLGDSQAPWEALASAAASAIFEQRSALGLVGNTLDADTRRWIKRECSVGAGVDSYLEYLLKSFLLHGKQRHLEEFAQVYAAFLRHMRFPEHGRWLYDVEIDKASSPKAYISSLGAFWPGMQALLGDTGDGALLHAEYGAAFRQFGFLPELFSPSNRQAHPREKSYPLRPEHAESAFLLHRATGDEAYLRSAAHVLEALRGTRTACGFAAVKDVKTKALDDRMESFFLSETLKYLFLAFDPDSDVLERFVFTTEGHLLPLNSTLRSRPSGSSLQDRRMDAEAHDDAAQLGARCADTLAPLANRSTVAAAAAADGKDHALRELARGRRCAAFLAAHAKIDALDVRSLETAPAFDPTVLSDVKGAAGAAGANARSEL